jgi:hypothetical protein
VGRVGNGEEGYTHMRASRRGCFRLNFNIYFYGLLKPSVLVALHRGLRDA